MITEAQKERRKRGIFASDVARIMEGQGVQVTLEKMGELEPADLSGIASVELGNILEKPVLDAYALQLQPNSMLRSPDTILHPALNWLGCHLDALADFGDNTRVVEAKAFSAFNRDGWGTPGTDEVPMARMWQCMAQMACTGAMRADIPITFVNEKVLAEYLTAGTVPIEIYTIMRDEDLIQYMVDEASKVWQCIETNTLPVPVNVGDAELIWRRGNPNKIVDADDDIFQLYSLLGKARANLIQAENSKALLESKIKNVMQDASELRRAGQTLVTWRNNKDGVSFDKDAFAAAHPDLLAKFSKHKNGARVFLFKE